MLGRALPGAGLLGRYCPSLKRNQDETKGRLSRAQEHRYADEDPAEEAELAAMAAQALPARARMN